MSPAPFRAVKTRNLKGISRNSWWVAEKQRLSRDSAEFLRKLRVLALAGRQGFSRIPLPFFATGCRWWPTVSIYATCALRAFATVVHGLPPFAASAAAMTLEMSLDVRSLAIVHGEWLVGGSIKKKIWESSRRTRARWRWAFGRRSLALASRTSFWIEGSNRSMNVFSCLAGES
jgi:hypothetical protein